MELRERVRETMRQEQMVERGGRVLAGVSGGADSVCLLELLRQLAPGWFSLRVMHVHHGLRGESADADERSVRELCRQWGIELISRHVDVAAEAARRGIGLEEAGHEIRRELFAQYCREWESEEEGRPVRVALAHHLEDQAETVLFHLCRGSALAGLAGMRPVSGRIIRPLLGISRQEIERELRESGIPWRTDETNMDLSFTRNRIRQEILPLLDSVHGGAVRHIAVLAGEAAQTEDYLQEQTRQALADCREQGGALRVPDLLRLPPLLRRRVLYSALARAAGGRRDITARHVRALEELCLREGSGSADLPGGVRAVRSGPFLVFPEAGEEVSLQSRDWPLSPDCYVCRIFSFTGDLSLVPRNRYTKWFDYDKITSFLLFRVRKTGDRITISADGRRKKLTRLMIDARIPSQVRDRMILPAVGDEILWVPGVRISAAYLVSADTRTVLEIGLSGEQ